MRDHNSSTIISEKNDLYIPNLFFNEIVAGTINKYVIRSIKLENIYIYLKNVRLFKPVFLLRIYVYFAAMYFYVKLNIIFQYKSIIRYKTSYIWGVY